MSSFFDVHLVTEQWARTKKLNLFSAATVKSTNDWAKEQIQSSLTKKEGQILPAVCLFVAGHQTHGRGRGSNTWVDAKTGVALLSSWVFHLKNPPSSVTAPRAGLALARAAHASFPKLHLSLKAPNDLYCGNRKLAGLLLENIQQGNENWLVVGLGLNVWESPSIHGKFQATSLQESSLSELTPVIWQSFLERLLGELGQFQKVVERSESAVLETQERQELLHFLNQNPNLQSPYTEISAQGDLFSATGQIPWTEL